MRILVTGASGFIGSRLCEEACMAGYALTGLVRPRARGITVAGCDRIVHGSLPYDIPAHAWEEVEAVVHCAAATTGQDDAESRAINLDGTRFLLEQAQRHRSGALRRFVFLSSQSAHSEAISAYGITKREGEELVRASGLPFAILRPGLVYGPGRHGLFARMRGTVKKLPVLPLLGGGKAIVQAIEVGDLAEAILRCLSLAPGENAELNLGDPEGLPLREFLQAISVAETGRRKLQVTVPLAPIKAVVSLGETLSLPLPISGDNIRGMEVVRRMETASSLERLGMTLKPLAEGMKQAVEERTPDAPCKAGGQRVVRVLVAGAGKIGIVHALNLRQREETALAAIVDPRPKAFRLYQSMGFETRYYEHLDTALREEKPDGVLLASPAATHLPLTRKLVERGFAVLVEKPLAVTPEELDAYLRLREEFPGAVVHSGYMAAQYPHLDAARDLLAAGRIGAVRSVRALALQSHIMAAKPVRWEMVKASAGGGALINFAGHVLSVLLRLFGLPLSFSARGWPVYSTEVEDAVDVSFQYAEHQARLFGTWSAPGFARPENRIEIEGENGEIIIENYCVSLRQGGRTAQVWTQRDYNVGFNAAPDYTGGGFAAEHRNFAQAIRDGAPGPAGPLPGERGFSGSLAQTPVGIEEAVRLEKLIHRIYGEMAWGEQTPPPAGDISHVTDRRIVEIIRSLGQ